ncbi:MAG: hypothetical protein JWL84_1380 [Rhodospirillales bacterium]|jgi:hypothetical protein|nr:hypothetical protein [Rhodospirillales bacterium]
MILEGESQPGNDDCAPGKPAPTFFRSRVAEFGPIVKQLGEAKGYCFVGLDLSGVNMFFVRADVERGDLAVVGLAEAFAQCREPGAAIEPTMIADAIGCGLLVRP